MNIKKLVDLGVIPESTVKLLSLGYFYTEQSNYAEWEAHKLLNLTGKYDIVEVTSVTSPAGKTTVFANAIEKGKAEAVFNLHECPYDCKFRGNDPADTAIHLTDKHCWAASVAGNWLRAVVSGAAFHEEV